MEGEDCRIINVSTIREAVVLNEWLFLYFEIHVLCCSSLTSLPDY